MEEQFFFIKFLLHITYPLFEDMFSLFVSYICVLFLVWKQENLKSFVHCLLISSAAAAILGSIESNSVALNSVFFFHSFQYLIQVVEHKWDM